MNCPICVAESRIIFNKQGYNYYQCSNCESVFVPEGIDQSDMVGGEHEIGRNEKENGIRIKRIVKLAGRYARVLDFGAGHGYLIKDLRDVGIEADGYDKFNKEFAKVPDGQFNLVSIIECIEHLYSPFDELNLIYDKLLPEGIVMIESSFTDVALQENIPLEEFFYINPERGHCTVFSHYGLDLLMIEKRFEVLPPINRNVRIYKKGIK